MIRFPFTGESKRVNGRRLALTSASPPLRSSPSKAADRLGDRRQPAGEVRAVAAPQRDTFAVLAGEEPVAVVLDFVQPAGTGDEERLTREEEPAGGLRRERAGEIRHSIRDM